MPRERSPKRAKAFEIYRQHGGNIENRRIAEMLEISEKTVGGWKCKDDWVSKLNGVRQPRKRSIPRTRGAQPGNKNAVGHGGTGPPGNKNAEKFGFFSKCLPEETREIFSAIEEAEPLDLLWHQIQIAYAAIIRAQRIMYVQDKDDRSKDKIGSFDNGDTFLVQEAWDKQASFLQAQARAQSELRSLIKQYDEMLHKNWDLVREEQKARIEMLKAKTQDAMGTGKEVVDDWIAAVSEECDKE